MSFIGSDKVDRVPGLIRTKSGENTKKPVDDLLSDFTSISSPRAWYETAQTRLRMIAAAVLIIPDPSIF
jgi:hypothetical protein